MIIELWCSQHSHLLLFLSTISQKSGAAARICRNMGSLVACANSNCFSKYLDFAVQKNDGNDRMYHLIERKVIGNKQKMEKKKIFQKPHTSFESLLGKTEAYHSPIHIHQLQPPYKHKGEQIKQHKIYYFLISVSEQTTLFKNLIVHALFSS